MAEQEPRADEREKQGEATTNYAAMMREAKEGQADIPKSVELFSGDINNAVIQVQKITGVEITPDWWTANVGDEGTTEQILGRFDAAYPGLVAERDRAA